MEGGEVRADDVMLGSEIEVVCHEGYQLVGGPPRATCGIGGVWGDIGSCQEVECPPLPEDIHHGRYLEILVPDWLVTSHAT